MVDNNLGAKITARELQVIRLYFCKQHNCQTLACTFRCCADATVDVN